MPDIFNFSNNMEDYFNSLSESIKEAIIQSGAKINTLEDLRAVAERMSGNG